MAATNFYWLCHASAREADAQHERDAERDEEPAPSTGAAPPDTAQRHAGQDEASHQGGPGREQPGGHDERDEARRSEEPLHPGVRRRPGPLWARSLPLTLRHLERLSTPVLPQLYHPIEAEPGPDGLGRLGAP